MIWVDLEDIHHSWVATTIGWLQIWQRLEFFEVADHRVMEIKIQDELGSILTAKNFLKLGIILDFCNWKTVLEKKLVTICWL